MIRYLLPEQVLFLHARLIEQTGGMHGVRDLPMLLSALGRPQAGMGDQELYPTLFAKAAALMDSMIRNHPFVDGNKRTAIAAAGIFLEFNGSQLTADDEEIVRFTLQCAQSQVSFEEITSWLERYSAPTSSSPYPD